MSGWDLVAPTLDILTPHWPHRCKPSHGEGMVPASGTIQVRVMAEAGGYRVSSADNGAHPLWYPDTAGAAHAAAGALVAARLAAEPEALAIHAAAVVIGSRAVVLVGHSQSGKSTIALHLAAGGHRLLGDDRLLLAGAGRSLEAVALGLAPKVRLPVPHALGPRFRTFVARREAARDAEPGAAYLALGASEQAPHGERVPVGALIRLTRQGGSATRLVALSRAAAVRTIIDHGSAPHLGSGAVLALATRMASRVPAFDLTYSVSRRAALALAARLGQENTAP
ncbi:MAG: hypothetical protein U1E97_11685 [Alphaproteobacteria bacterium]